ncbi:MAG: hypothetical protein N2645_15780 [Clostridia bacterium]|nr:hypothetical protein [Clostridia bacterium]
MLNVELVNLLQIFIIIFSLVWFTWGIVRIQSGGYHDLTEERARILVFQALFYERKLFVKDYESYHKYEVWRLYLFS